MELILITVECGLLFAQRVASNKAGKLGQAVRGQIQDITDWPRANWDQSIADRRIYAAQDFRLRRNAGSRTRLWPDESRRKHSNGIVVGPHVFYIELSGVSSLLGLIAFIVYIAVLLWFPVCCRTPNIRASMVRSTVVFTRVAMSSHSFLNHPYMGPFVATFVIAGKYVSRLRRIQWFARGQ